MPRLLRSAAPAPAQIRTNGVEQFLNTFLTTRRIKSDLLRFGDEVLPSELGCAVLALQDCQVYFSYSLVHV